MEYREVLNRRRMVRNYTDEPIDGQSLDRIARAALRAPSAGYSQGVAVIVITDEDVRKAIATVADEEAYVVAGFDPWISRAPAHIVITVSENVYRDRYNEPDKLDADGNPIEWPIPYWWVDAGASLMAVLLAAVDEGLAAGFLGVHSLPDLSRVLGIPQDYLPIGVVTVGHAAADRRSSSLARGAKPDEVVLHRDKWRQRST
jgi:nitroreductase